MTNCTRGNDRIRSPQLAWRRWLQILCVLSLPCLLFATVQLNAQIDDVHVSQLGHRAWRVRESALPGVPNAFVQTSDGFFWVGTEAGVYRFDGEQFQAVEARPGMVLRVSSMLADRDGSLWVAASYRIFHARDGHLREVLHGPKVDQMIQTTAGEVWAATTHNETSSCRLRNEQAECFRGPDLDGVAMLASDGQQGLWMSDQRKVAHWQAGRGTLNDGKTPFETSSTTVMSGDGRGKVFIGVHGTGELPALFLHENGEWKRMPVLPGVTSSTEIQTILLDRNQALWVGTSNSGLYRLLGNKIDRFTRADGLTGDDVRDVMQDHEGSIWIATSAGIDQLRRSPVDTWSTREGLTADSVSAILADHQGRIWMANEGGLDVLEDGDIHSYKAGKELPGQTVAGLAEDHRGRIWAGVDEGLWILTGNTFQRVPGPDGKNIGLTVSMTEDVKGAMWVVTQDGLFRVGDHTTEKVDWKDARKITTIVPDPIDGVWIGARGMPRFHVAGDATTIQAGPSTSSDLFEQIYNVDGELVSQTQQGLSVVRGGKTLPFDQKNGLPYKALLAGIRGLNGDLYLMTESSYLRISNREFLHWLRDPGAVVQSQTLDVTDGALTASSVFGPTVTVAPNGDLWFATDRFPQRIRKNVFDEIHQPPPVVVESALANGQPLDIAARQYLPPGTLNLEIDYAALSYLNPQKIRYRYLLEGFDHDWQDAGNRRRAIYTRLPPAAYRFRVLACEEDGPCSPADASFSFELAPRFYQRYWFKALVAVAACGLLWSLYLLRTNFLIKRARAILFERMSERERIARDLHDTFFQGIQGLLLQIHTGTSAMRRDEPVRPVFEEILKRSDQVMLEGRELVLDLRTPFSESGDLAEAFAAICEDMQQLRSTRFEVSVQGKARPLHVNVREELYRIGKEAITNAFLHAEAGQIEVELLFEAGALTLRIRDDGKGMPEEVKERGERPGHFGMQGMRERGKNIGAAVHVWSQTGAGTEIDVRIPASVAWPSENRYLRWLASLRTGQV